MYIYTVSYGLVCSVLLTYLSAVTIKKIYNLRRRRVSVCTAIFASGISVSDKYLEIRALFASEMHAQSFFSLDEKRPVSLSKLFVAG
jgi:hypothetical protein